MVKHFFERNVEKELPISISPLNSGKRILSMYIYDVPVENGGDLSKNVTDDLDEIPDDQEMSILCDEIINEDKKESQIKEELTKCEELSARYLPTEDEGQVDCEVFNKRGEGKIKYTNVVEIIRAHLDGNKKNGNTSPKLSNRERKFKEEAGGRTKRSLKTFDSGGSSPRSGIKASQGSYQGNEPRRKNSQTPRRSGQFSKKGESRNAKIHSSNELKDRQYSKKLYGSAFSSKYSDDGMVFLSRDGMKVLNHQKWNPEESKLYKKRPGEGNDIRGRDDGKKKPNKKNNKSKTLSQDSSNSDTDMEEKITGLNDETNEAFFFNVQKGARNDYEFWANFFSIAQKKGYGGSSKMNKRIRCLPKELSIAKKAEEFALSKDCEILMEDLHRSKERRMSYVSTMCTNYSVLKKTPA